MARTKGSKNKPKIPISEEDKKALADNTLSPQQMAEKYNAPIDQIYNIKNKQKLSVSYSLKEPQTNLRDLDNKQIIPSQSIAIQDNITPQINYDDQVNSLWSSIDMIFGLVAIVSRGKIEYTPLTKEEIQKLTNATKTNGIIQRVSSEGGLSNILMVGTVLFIFKNKIKIVKSDKEDKKVSHKSESHKSEVKEEKPNLSEEDFANIDEEMNKIKAQIEYNDNLPSDGIILEDNQSLVKSEVQVLEQNKLKSENEKRFDEVRTL